MKHNVHIKILKCDSGTAWYKDHVGGIFRAADNVFAGRFMLDAHRKSGPYRLVEGPDAEVIKPNLLQRIECWYKDLLRIKLK